MFDVDHDTWDVLVLSREVAGRDFVVTNQTDTVEFDASTSKSMVVVVGGNREVVTPDSWGGFGPLELVGGLMEMRGD